MGTMRRLSTGLFVAIIVVLGGLTASPQAHADDAAPVNWWRTTVKLTSDGMAQVEHEFEMDFSRVEGHGPVIALPTRQRTKNEDEWLNYGISNIARAQPSSARSDTKDHRAERIRHHFHPNGKQWRHLFHPADL